MIAFPVKNCNLWTRYQITKKDENKQTALGTSKINYIDPRISAAWCHKHDVPLDKIFNKSLRDKFKWAMETKKDFVMIYLN
jgi:DNA topoisomerase-1